MFSLIFAHPEFDSLITNTWYLRYNSNLHFCLEFVCGKSQSFRE